MLSLNDVVLFLVLFCSMLGGILMPHVGLFIQPYTLFFLMFLLFLSYLSINLDTIWNTVRTSARTIVFLTTVKMIVLPLGVYFIFNIFYPAYAPAALLLTGISTGVAAPFISTLVKANTSLVLVMVVITAPLAPFILPTLVKLLLAQSMDISLLSMIRMLCLVVFIPILAVEVFRRLTPAVIRAFEKKRFLFSLIMIALVNFGVFSQYADFFRQKPHTILVAILVAVALGIIYFMVGILVLWGSPVENQLAGIITIGNMNNVLVIVFSSQFFGPLEPTVAAMYMIPFFFLIFPLSMYRRWRQNHGEA